MTWIRIEWPRRRTSRYPMRGAPKLCLEALERRDLLANSIALFPIPHAPSGSFLGGDLTVGPDNNLWFNEGIDNQIGRMTPTGVVNGEFPVPFSTPALTLTGITTGPDGNVWFTDFDGQGAGVITTAGVVSNQFQLPKPGGGFIQAGGGITTGPDGNLWLTSGIQAPGATGFVVSLSTSGTSTAIALGGPGDPGAAGITTGPDGNLWFTEHLADRIGMINPSTLQLTEFPIPTASSGPARITVGPNNDLFFTELEADQIGEITTSGQITEFPIPESGCGPNGIVEGPDGNLWITLEHTGQLARMTPTGSFTIFNVPATNVDLTAIVTGPDKKSLFFLAAGPDDNSPGFIGKLTLDTTLAHIGPTNAQLPANCASGNGQFTVFLSNAPNVVPGEVNSSGLAQLFLLDRTSGVTTLVSHIPGSQVIAGNDEALAPAISVDGNFVAFEDVASNLVAGESGPAGNEQIYLFNRQTGVISLVSHNNANATQMADNSSFLPFVSANGAFVTYTSQAADLISGFTGGNGGINNVFVEDTASGVNTLASADSGDSSTSGSDNSTTIAISDDGRFICYTSFANNLVAGDNITAGTQNVYLFDGNTNTNVLVSHIASSQTTSPSVDSNNPAISGNGAFVAFVSTASNLVNGQSAGIGDTNVFLYNVATGAITLVTGADGSPTVTANGNSNGPAIDTAGDFLAFSSDASNLFSAQTGPAGSSNVFRYNTNSGALTLVSHNSGAASTTANGNSGGPVISGDGSFIAYLSAAPDLVTGQSGGGANNVFTWLSGMNVSFLSSGTNGSSTVVSQGNALSLTISRDPVVFFSHNGNLITSTDHAQNDYAFSLIQITFTPAPLSNGNPAGTVAGTLTVTSSLVGQLTTVQISLPAGGAADNVKFTIAQTNNTGNLITQFQVNPAQQSSFSILVQAGVTGLGNFQQTFSLSAGVAASGGPLTVAYVTKLFQDILRRPPDSGGLANFAQALDGGTRTSQQVAATLVGSSEYHAIEVANAYSTILGRKASGDPNGFAFWLGFLNGGGTLVQLETQFYGSAEFFIRSGGTGTATNTTYVAALYQNILRRPADSASSFWVGLLNNGASLATVAGDILGSQEADTLVIGVLYLNFLQRQVDPAGLQGNVNALQQGATQEQVLVGLVASSEYQTLAVADLDQAYVGNLFGDALSRAADPSGLANFTTPLDNNTRTRTQVVQAILTSTEYRTDVVESLYKQYLNRNADASGLNGELAALGQGATDEGVAATLIASAEFFNDNGNNNTGFVQALYKEILQRTPSMGEVNGWVTALQNGVSRLAVAGAFLVSDEYHRLVVGGLYERYLHRAADTSGLNGLAAALDSGTTDEAAIAFLSTSAEYFERG